MSDLDSSLNESVSLNEPKNDKNIQSYGLKHFLHGDMYQIKILLLFLLRGLKDNDFELFTEMKVGGKFDDVVYISTDKNGEKTVRFLQVKHTQNEKEKINFNDFIGDKTNNKKGIFKLLQFLLSFKNIITCEKFKDYKFKDFIIFTNYGINIKNETIDLIEVKEDDMLFPCKRIIGKPVPGDKAIQYKFQKNVKSYNIFKCEDDLHVLSAKLALGAHDKEVSLSIPIFSKYHIALKDEKILIKNGGNSVKFHEHFITGDPSTFSESFKEFRKQFLIEYKKKKWQTQKLKVSLQCSTPSKLDPRYDKQMDDKILKEIANKIVDHILSSKENTIMKFDGIPDKYISMLKMKVFQNTDDNNTVNFLTTFIQGKGLTQLASNFRKLFVQIYDSQFPDEKILQDLEKTSLTFDRNFGNFFDEDSGDSDLEEMDTFKKYIDRKIINSTAVSSFIKNRYGKKERKKTNFEKLAGKNRAIVYDDGESGSNKKVLKFSTAFINDSDALSNVPENLKAFRKMLTCSKEELEKFRFTISDYYTEYETKRSLPPVLTSEESRNENEKMVGKFLDAFVLAVNQPNEEELTEIIKTELAQLSPIYDIYDIDSAFCYLLVDIFDWVKKKKETSYTKKMFKKTLNDINIKLSKRYVMRLSYHFCTKLQQPSPFSPPFQEITKFLKNEEKKVLWALVKNDKLSRSYASGIFKTLENEQYLSDNGVPGCYFKSTENYIFHNLSFLMISYGDVFPVVNELSCINLIVIVDDNIETNETAKFYECICGIKNDYLKIIIITSDLRFIPFKTNDRFKHLFEEYTVNVSVNRQVEEAVKDLQSVEIEKPN